MSDECTPGSEAQETLERADPARAWVDQAALRLHAARAHAQSLAETELAARGFTRADHRTDDRTWAGHLELLSGDTMAARVRIPDAFPDVLPDVMVDRASLPRRIAHHEKSAKVCVAPTSGLLLDATQPAALVGEALTRAAGTVTAGIAGTSDPDLQAEFLAYWPGRNGTRTYSVCDPTGPAHEVVTATIHGVRALGENTVLVADSRQAAVRWADQLSGRLTAWGRAYFLPLASAFEPPAFDESLPWRRVRQVITQHAAPADVDAALTWMGRVGPPVLLLFSIPSPSDIDAPGQTVDRIVVAVRVEPPVADAAKRARAGFRPGRVPPDRVLAFASQTNVTLVDLQRLDATYLTARGGAGHDLASRSVVVVGVGAVGSHVAAHLATMGVGRSVFLDPDVLGAENVHRHVLGIDHLHAPKATALANVLGARFPHLEFVGRQGRVEDLIASEPSLFAATDLFVIAVGDETVELRLNAMLHGGPPRVHTWLEPLGLAGHALACGVGGVYTGCYRCLFKPIEKIGLVNTAALTKPGQQIQRSVAGCAGTFSPFSGLDADRTALEAAALAGRILTGEQSAGALVTWRGDDGLFERLGYQLSPRATLVAPGTRVTVNAATLAQHDCPDCATARHEA